MSSKDIEKLEQKLLPWDAHAIRQDFPILSQTMNDYPLVYLDSAATTQKPRCVIERLIQFYTTENSNVHRGVYVLAEQATMAFEDVRKIVKSFIHARAKKEIVFTKGATEAINLVASSYGRTFLMPGDEILVSTLEHHANIVPWQMLADEKEVVVRPIPLLENGDLDLIAYENLLNDKTRLVCLTQISNSIGTENPVKEMIALAHQAGAKVLIDACQSVAHQRVDVQDLDCDFLVFSSHKIYGPTGVGVLYAKEALLNSMPPYQGGGDMIKFVSFAKTEFSDPPYRFEAGTPNIADVIAFGTALEYFKALPAESLLRYEHELLDYAIQGLRDVPGLSIIGSPRARGPIISFVMNSAHPHDIATIISESGVAIRAGHHCSMPTISAFGVAATARVSLSFYNTFSELDLLFNALHVVNQVFQS